jgi:NADPH-dependent curcumin reductase CurA
MTGERINRQFRLAGRPIGVPKRSDWAYDEVPVPPLEAGQVLVQVDLISLDPAMRGWMNEGKSYIKPVEIGEVMRAGAGGRVVESRNAAFSPGDTVTGALGVQSWSVSEGKGLDKVDLALAPLAKHLGVLGMPGMTGYFGLLEIGQPKAGETVVV